MRYFKNVMVITLAVLGMLIASNVYAFEKGNAQGRECAMSAEKGKKMDEKHQKMWDQLNLTPEQKKQLEDNKAKNREGMKATFEKMESYRESLKAELMKPELDMNKINDIQSQIKLLESQMTDSRLNSILEVRKIMTREQFEKFIELTGKHKPWHGKNDRGTSKKK